MTFQVDISLHDLSNPITLDVTIDQSELEGLHGKDREEKIEEIMREVVFESIAIHWSEKNIPVLR